MRLTEVGFIAAVGMALVIPAAGHAADSSEAPTQSAEPAPPAETRLADAPEQVGHSFRQIGDSVEHGAKTIGHTVEYGAKQFGRSVAEGWRSFKRGLNGD
jgi:hypothetical protein